MAITRCPYCHAIIDENDKYCNNCGTQLLFPEDEETDEEIPGEKILDAEVEEKDYTIDEPEDEKRPRPAADDDEDIDERLEEEMRDRAAETALDEIVAEGGLDEEGDDVTEEVILVDELADTGLPDAAGTGEIEATAGTGLEDAEEEGPVKDEDGAEEEETEEEIEKIEEEEVEEGSEPGQEEGEGKEELEEQEEEEQEEEEEEEKEEKAGQEAGGEEGQERPAEQAASREGDQDAPEEETTEYTRPRQDQVAVEEEPEVEYISVPDADDGPGAEEVLSPRAETFDTQELEGIGHTVELSKDKVDMIVAEMADGGAAAVPSPAAAEAPREPTGSLPPWASGMKGAPVFPPDSATVEGKPALRERGPTPQEEEEVEIFPKRRSSDSTLGLPERIGQSPLPFGGDGPEADRAEEDLGTAEGTEEESVETTPPPPGPVRPAMPAAPPEREPEARRIEAMEEYDEPGARGPFSFTIFLKSKAFDLLFVGLFWLVALWLAAHATGRTLFEVLGEVSGPMLLLYGVFVLLYFFLFKFFLGETLGDRLFRPRD